MKFDYIIGNPPYQENINDDGGNSSLAKQLFPAFVKDAIESSESYVSFIIPARWFTGDAQDKSFLKLRSFIRENNHISHLYYYENAKEVFPNVALKGGVCYFLYNKHYNGTVNFYTCKSGSEFLSKRNLFIDGIDIILTDNIYPQLIDKINTVDFISLTTITKGRNAFGIVGKQDVIDDISEKEYFENAYELRCKADEIRYVSKDKITKNIDLADKYKVFISKSAGDPRTDKKVIGNPYVGKLKSVCSDSLIPIGDFNTEIEAENLSKYLMTKFSRALIQISKSSQNVYQIVYRFVPLQDFTENSDIDWSVSIKEIDKQLYRKYNLSDDEIKFIENNVKEMA